MIKTAVLIDGGYFIKRLRTLDPESAKTGELLAQAAFETALKHLGPPLSKNKKQNNEIAESFLYRIFFYDCPPLEKKLHNPISKKLIDYAKSSEALFRHELHDALRKKRKVALRLGRLSPEVNWVFKSGVIERLLKKELSIEQLSPEDVIPSFRQKGVDMRIGLDISSIALKKQADQIVLIAGDADFVPAAKFARREGIDFVLDAMWQEVSADLFEHIDGLRSVCKKPFHHQ